MPTQKRDSQLGSGSRLEKEESKTVNVAVASAESKVNVQASGTNAVSNFNKSSNRK